MLKYKIYQLSVEDENSPGFAYKFWDWDKIQLKLKDNNISLGEFLNMYELKYEGEIEEGKSTIGTLEKVYRMFNDYSLMPDDFKGHSLSMSDIVELDDIKYICDTIGFAEVK